MTESAVLLRYKVDQAALRQAIQSNDIVAKRLERLAVESDVATKQVVKLRAAMKDMKGDDLDRARVQIVRIEEALAKSRDEADKLIKKLDDIPAEKQTTIRVNAADAADERFSRVSQQVGLFGDAETAVRALGATGAVPDVLAAAEALPRLKTAIEGLPAQAQAAAAALGAGGVGLIGVLAAVGAGVVALNASLSESKQQLDAATAANQRYYELLGSGATTEQAEQTLEDLKRSLAAQREELASIEGAFASGFESTAEQIGEAGARVLYALAQVSNADDKLTARADELRGAIAEAEAEATRLEGALKGGAFAANDTVEAEKELTATRQTAFANINTLLNQQFDMLDAFDKQNLRALEDRQRREAQQLEDHHERLAAMEAQGQQRLAAIRQQGMDKLAQVDAQISKVNDALVKANADFMASERKRVEKLAADLRRMDAQANKERIRRLEDLSADLLEAEAANDVNRFIEAQRRGETDLRRMSEDADDATRRRLEQAEEERRAAEEAHRQRLADIQTQIAEQQAARVQVQADIAAQLAAEKTRIAESEAAAQAAFDKAQAREAAADELRDARQSEDLRAQLKAIDDKIAAEKIAAGIINTAHVTAAQQGAAAVQAAYAGAFNSIRSAGAFGVPASTGLSALSGPRRPTPFADGGIVDRPTLGLLGERPGWGDVVIPYRKSEGIDSALARHGAGISLSFGNINLGGISRAEFDAGMQYLASQVVNGVEMAVGGRG